METKLQTQDVSAALASPAWEVERENSHSDLSLLFSARENWRRDQDWPRTDWVLANLIQTKCRQSTESGQEFSIILKS